MYSERTDFRVAHGTEWETVWYAGRRQTQSDGKVGVEYSRPSKADCATIIHNRDERLMAIGKNADLMLRNGARFYIDVGEKMEYAGPETASVEEAEQRQLDAEAIMLDAIETTTQNPRPNDRLPIIKGALYKRTYSSGRVFNDDGSFTVYDRGPQSCGFHLNVGLPRREEDTSVGLLINDQDLALYGLFVATSAPLLGSGLVEPYEGRFLLHQRLPFIGTDFSTGTTVRRPVVNTRHEPHSGGVRVHGITLDPCISPWSGIMQRGLPELVLRLSALNRPGWAPAGLKSSGIGASLDAIANIVGRDLTFKKTFRLDDGQKITALNVHEGLYAAARKMSEEVELSAENYWVLDEWERAIDDLKTNPMLLADRHDWPMKLKMFLRGITTLDSDSLREIQQYPWKSHEAEIKDTEFTRLGPGTISEKLRTRTWAKWMPKTEAGRTMAERCAPPTTTRAAIRGAYIDMYGVAPKEEGWYGAVWATLGDPDYTDIYDVFETDTRLALAAPPPHAFMDYYGAEDWSD